MTGTVVKSTGSWYVVREAETGELHRCRLRGKFKLKDLKVSNPLAVGDVVTFATEAQGAGAAVITEIAPRRNYIIRQSVHKTGHAHIVAANIDQALLVVTLVSPATSFGFIDRFLVTAEAYHIPACLLFNKADLYDADLREYQGQIADLYASLGYPGLTCSAQTGEGRGRNRRPARPANQPAGRPFRRGQKHPHQCPGARPGPENRRNQRLFRQGRTHYHVCRDAARAR